MAARETKRCATGLLMVAMAALIIAAYRAHAADINLLRLRAGAAVVACLFAPTCDVGDFGADGYLSSADVLAAQQIPQTDPASYSRLSIAGDLSSSGVFDPSLVFPSDSDDGWMAYSGVDYDEQDGVLVRDVTTRLAASSDGGTTWQTRATINPPMPMTLTVRNANLCGQPQCAGRMISEVPFLADDASDPDTQRRFKLFAHRYFIYPPAAERGEDLQRAFGSINLRTAPAPAGPWSDDIALLGWNLTPPEIGAAINVNLLGPEMATCLAVSEGGAAALGDGLDVVFICPYVSSGAIRQRIVLLRSRDHAASFEFIATLLDDEHAASIDAESVSAPSLFVASGRMYLLATPVIGSGGTERYAGCVLIAFRDRQAGTLEHDRNGAVIIRAVLPTEGNRFGGACAWDPRAASGILMSQLFLDAGTPSFRIFSTTVR